MFLWRNGAVFDNTMNKYTSAAFPAGIDPRFPAILKAFGPFNKTLDTFNGTLFQGIEFTHPTSFAHPNLLNSSPGLSPDTIIDPSLIDTS